MFVPLGDYVVHISLLTSNRPHLTTLHHLDQMSTPTYVFQ